jgi:hypothetical protein
MLIIAFEKGCPSGGYGDRIVGLISIYNICKILNRDFKILWNKEDVTKYIDYSKYQVDENINIDEVINLVEYQFLYKNYLLKNIDVFPKKVYKFYLNQEISQYLFHNPIYSKNNFFESIIESYKSLYTEILVPTDYILQKINDIIPDNNENIIGIQIRSGDVYMNTGQNEIFCAIRNPDIEIMNILSNIKLHIEKNHKNYKIFITSDYFNIYGISTKIWNVENVIYFDQLIQHLDRNPSGDFSKIFLDNYVLSKYTKRLYISDYSNYGRIAALSSESDDIFNLKCEKLEKKSLISKQENLIN